jgi:dynamin 1-like protein
VDGKVIPLRLGFIGVVNRGQLDIKKNVDVLEALEKEKAFFMEHPAYCTLKGMVGTDALVARLSSQLHSRIKVAHARGRAH